MLVIRNEENRGFAAGCNQGLARARGRYLVFLNNDTVVPPGWLEGLVAWALHDWPHTGLAGAVTSYAAPPQEIPVSYRSLEELDAFAARVIPTEDRAAVVADPMSFVSDLSFVGMVGIIDPLRAEAKAAVHTALGAGIDVRMITGDHTVTARAIADELGLGEGVIT